MLMPDGLADDLGRLLGPDERSRVLIPLIEVALDVAHESSDGIEGTAPDRFPRQDAEPRLDQVDPRGALGSEVKLDSRVSGQPSLDRWGGVRGGVVENHVE